jgi:hypothetical protein
MLARSEHRRVLDDERREAGRAAVAHREVTASVRAAWRRERTASRDALGVERRRLATSRHEHKQALSDQQGLLALVRLIEARIRKGT